MHPQIEHLRKLPVAEKLQVLEELWDDLSTSANQCPLPRWMLAEVDRRAADLKADPSLSISEEEFWQRVGRPPKNG